jgi:2-oxoglutarate dehydrogenase E2 component (dihydrolipoamide succinyltransferase)
MTTTFDILAPTEQSEGTRFQILRWLRSVGDSVTEHEPLLEIETDKVTLEVAAPVSGVLREILMAERDQVAPGAVLGRLEPETETATGPQRAIEPPPSLEPGVSNGMNSDAPTVSSTSTSSRDKPSSLSPTVRRLIRERNFDAAAIRGTGEGGRITVDDVLSFEIAAPSLPPPTRSVPHTVMRKRIATHMVQSLLHTAPHVTAVFEADLSNVVAHQVKNAVEFGKRAAPLSHTAYFLAAIVKAIRAVPESNSRWTDSSLEVYENVHIGIATATKDAGLIVPVLRNVESLDLFGIAKALYELVTAVRKGELKPADVRGGTFTISNYGGDGCLLAAPVVINQPQSAILGVGKPEKRVVVIEQGGDEHVVVRRKSYVTLTFDHRVMDGHRASRFLEVFVSTLGEWPY